MMRERQAREQVITRFWACMTEATGDILIISREGMEPMQVDAAWEVSADKATEPGLLRSGEVLEPFEHLVLAEGDWVEVSGSELWGGVCLLPVASFFSIEVVMNDRLPERSFEVALIGGLEN